LVKSIHEVAMYPKMSITCNIPISEKLPYGPRHNGYHKFYYTSVARSMSIASFLLNFNTAWRWSPSCHGYFTPAEGTSNTQLIWCWVGSTAGLVVFWEKPMTWI